MANLSQIAAALRAADAAGNTEDAKRLAAAYRQAQSSASEGATVSAPSGLVPGSSEYAAWAMEQARAGNKLPLVSDHDFTEPVPDKWNSLGDKVQAAAASWIEGAPIVGPTWMDGAEKLRSMVQGIPEAQVEAETDKLQADNPITSAMAGIGSSIATLAPLGATALGGKLLGMTGSLPARIGFGMGSGGAISAADTLARGGSVEDAGTSALLGAGLGAVFPAVGGVVGKAGQAISRNKAISAAIEGAPTSAELKDAARAMFREVDQAGVTIDTPKFAQFVADLVTSAKQGRINPDLDQKATGAYRSLIDALRDVQTNGGVLTMSDMHTLRQIAQKAATSAEGRDAFFAGQIVDGLDSFISQPGSAVLPANRLGSAGGGADTLKEAIGTWGRARRVELVDDAISRAHNAASGFENGLRVEFRKLLNNPKTSRLFSEIERAEIERVVQGTPGSNLSKLIGKFGFGSGNNGLGGFLGGVGGFTFGGPVGAAAAALGTSGARKVSEVLTQRAAERAAKVVATPMPTIGQQVVRDALLAPAVLPLEVTRKRQPIEITVIGGAR